MKKQYVTRIDESALGLTRIFVSGGRLGMQIEIAPDDLARASEASFEQIIKD